MATLSELTTYLAQLKAARTAILDMKSYTIGEHSLTRADEKWISSEIKEVESRIAMKSRGNSVQPVFINNRG